MRCVEAICDNGQLMVDIFVNYDCDLEGANLFERLIGALVRLAQGTQDKEAPPNVAAEETNLRLTVCRSPEVLTAMSFCSCGFLATHKLRLGWCGNSLAFACNAQKYRAVPRQNALDQRTHILERL